MCPSPSLDGQWAKYPSVVKSCSFLIPTSSFTFAPPETSDLKVLLMATSRIRLWCRCLRNFRPGASHRLRPLFDVLNCSYIKAERENKADFFVRVGHDMHQGWSNGCPPPKPWEKEFIPLNARHQTAMFSCLFSMCRIRLPGSRHKQNNPRSAILTHISLFSRCR